MEERSEPVEAGHHGEVREVLTEARQVVTAIEDFQDRSQEWRRLFSELLGTLLLVLMAAGGGMMGKAFPDTVSRTAAVAAPALMVLAVILFMGRVSGAHLNPAVSVAFALRGDFPWRRVPGYVVVQLAGAVLAVGVAFVLRGPGGGRSGSTAAQGALFTDVKRPDQR